MKKILALLLLITLSSFIFAKETIYGRIIKVSDGDTVTLLNRNKKQYKIRLYGIDCPEKGQDYFQVAKNYVNKSLYNKEVKVEIVNKDRYQRYVGVIYYNNKNFNVDMIKQGLAWHYKAFDKSKTYEIAEKEARLAKRNIWSTKNQIAPWEFRKKNKTI